MGDKSTHWNIPRDYLHLRFLEPMRRERERKRKKKGRKGARKEKKGGRKKQEATEDSFLFNLLKDY